MQTQPKTPPDRFKVSEQAYEQCEREFACGHEQTALRYREASNGARHYRRQCLRCGANSENVRVGTLTAAQRDAAEPINDDLAQSWRDRRWARYAEIRAELTDARGAEWWAWYDAYLKSEEWQTKRLAVLERCGGLCEGCRKGRATEIHHLTYERVGHEMLFDLVGICDACHATIHAEEAENPSC